MSCLSAKFGRASGGSLGDNGFDDTGLEEPVRVCIAPAVALERFDEYHGWGDWWPESFVAKGANERKCSCRAFGEAADASAVDDQHELAGLVELTIADASHDRVGSRLLTHCWFADFGDEFREVIVGCVEYVATFEFGTHGNLEQFRGGQIAPLELVVEGVWKVHLQPWHTPKHTPSRLVGQASFQSRPGCGGVLVGRGPVEDDRPWSGESVVDLRCRDRVAGSLRPAVFLVYPLLRAYTCVELGGIESSRALLECAR